MCKQMGNRRIKNVVRNMTIVLCILVIHVTFREVLHYRPHYIARVDWFNQ